MKKFLLPCFLALGMCVSAQTYFSDNFDDEDVSDWTRIDADGDGRNWADIFVVPDENGNPTTPVSLISRSWQVSALTPDNWIISPAINLTSATGTVSLNWKVKCAPFEWDKENYSVYVSTSNTTAALLASPVKFTETYDDPENLGRQYSRTLDVSSFAGQTIYVAFRHHNVTDMDYISIDDVVVKSPETVAPSCTTLTSPANAATGVAVSGAVLNWAAATGADSYDIYLGTTATPTTLLANATGTSYTLTTTLASNTTYYWSVVPKNNVGSATGCSVFSFTTKTANPPGCVGNLTPANGSNVSTGTVPLSWTAPTTGGTATSYDVYWGTSATTLTKLGNTVNTAVNITNVTAGSYYFQVVAINADGAATGCAINNITAVNPFAPYCGPLTYSTIEPISYVNMKHNTANTSSASATGASAHEAFITKEFKVEQGTTTEISVNSNTGGAFTHYYSVFVDWNKDGDFADAGESYFTTSGNFFTNNASTGSGTTGIKTKALTVPATATLGKTRMRVKAFYAAATPSATAIANIANPCTNPATAAYGQAEDYTIEVVAPGTLAVSDVNKTDVSVYPNPFTDVLNISDVKGVKSVSINDISGREVKTLAPATELNLSNLNAGLYIVNLKMEDGSVKTFKAIKK
ncbi:T9SS-dependent choice-of-anchor J family protein [Epilithonimonas arachidiradicis]|uniref:Putative secreted protein (Por secretion system target) n=1 Tax=Epilithonimonas arachidiradicis TaxID=1617282 RepID=A0A420DC55_9FLAO|nr:choice-of-anchor J domain-containing protein [Epilithonimonas arachidiradicis]RKE88827.1 putative secreted protein (Por secretion system target) [Epilithonimonas arachidiradicis]GGG54769.1 hypothetical protein GCM10007332_15510 [Epilithonimonas arachidiradicis]